jgi:hypothetical protein
VMNTAGTPAHEVVTQFKSMLPELHAANIEVIPTWFTTTLARAISVDRRCRRAASTTRPTTDSSKTSPVTTWTTPVPETHSTCATRTPFSSSRIRCGTRSSRCMSMVSVSTGPPRWPVSSMTSTGCPRSATWFSRIP